MITQLPLGLSLNSEATFASFYISPENAELISCVSSMSKSTGEKFAFIWGSSGSGKTHVLQAACNQAFEYGSTAVYLSLKEVSIKALCNLETINLICIDDLENCASNTELQTAIFHLYNKVKENGNRLLFAAELAPRNIGFTLADLKSRLTWGMVLQLHNLDDVSKVLALQLRADCLGFKLETNVANYLLRHYMRDTRELFAVLGRLDFASLARQRKLTIPFVKSVLDAKV